MQNMKTIFVSLTVMLVSCASVMSQYNYSFNTAIVKFPVSANIQKKPDIYAKDAIREFKMQTKECSKADERKLTKITQKARPFSNWAGVHQAYSQFAQCDDGFYAEKFSNEVIYLLASKWNQLNALNTIVSKDKKFEEFVISHIDATGDDVELQKVLENSKGKCQKSLSALCSKINNAASAALQP